MRKEQKNQNRKGSVIVGESTETAWDVIPEDSTLHFHLCENLVSRGFMLVYCQMWYMNWFTVLL
jgi:hypothetical protein